MNECWNLGKSIQNNYHIGPLGQLTQTPLPTDAFVQAHLYTYSLLHSLDNTLLFTPLNHTCRKKENEQKLIWNLTREATVNTSAHIPFM